MNAIRLARVDTSLVKNAVLAVLAEEFDAFENEYVSLRGLTQRIPGFSINYLRDALESLLHAGLVSQQYVRKNVSPLGLLGKAEYEDVPTDAWRIKPVGFDVAFKFLEKQPDRLDGLVIPLAAIQEGDDSDERADSWEPLPIDRNSPSYKTMIEAAESAVREVEKSNGYATSEPDERAGILAAMQGTIKSIKEGLPSRALIVAGLLAPLRRLADKFSSASIGELAKRAVEALIAWLS